MDPTSTGRNDEELSLLALVLSTNLPAFAVSGQNMEKWEYMSLGARYTKRVRFTLRNMTSEQLVYLPYGSLIYLHIG